MKLIPGFILRQNGGGAYPMTKHLLTSSFTHVSLDWFKVNLQENVKKTWFPVDVPLNQPIECQKET